MATRTPSPLQRSNKTEDRTPISDTKTMRFRLFPCIVKKREEWEKYSFHDYYVPITEDRKWYLPIIIEMNEDFITGLFNLRVNYLGSHKYIPPKLFTREIVNITYIEGKGIKMIDNTDESNNTILRTKFVRFMGYFNTTREELKYRLRMEIPEPIELHSTPYKQEVEIYYA